MAHTSKQVVAVLGRGVVEADEPVATADNYGLTRGDGCFEATLVRTAADGVSTVDHLEAHLDRLAHSVACLGIQGAPERRQWQATIAEVVSRWDTPGEALLKLVLTRGREFVAQAPPHAQVLLTELDAATIAERDGIAVVSLNRGCPLGVFADAPWLLGGVKSVSYAVNMAARREAASRGAADALFVTTDGYALEGPTSALVWAVGGELVSTRVEGTGILASITQATLFQAAAAAGITCRYDVIPAVELPSTDGAWLLSSVRGVAPIRTLDGREMPYDAGLSARVTTLAGFSATSAGSAGSAG